MQEVEEHVKQEDNKPKRDERGRLLPGNSGNLNGRPPGKTLKEYQAEVFRSWTDEQKEKFLKKIQPSERWRMSEGNPQTDVTSKGEKLMPTPILGGIANEIYTDNSIAEDTGIKEAPENNPGGNIGQ